MKKIFKIIIFLLLVNFSLVTVFAEENSNISESWENNSVQLDKQENIEEENDSETKEENKAVEDSDKKQVVNTKKETEIKTEWPELDRVEDTKESESKTEVDSIELPSYIEKPESELEKIYTERKDKITQLIDDEEDVQNVDSIKSAIEDIKIKTELNKDLFDDFSLQVKELEENILKNQELITELWSDSSKNSVDDKLTIEKLQTLNSNYKKQISYKQLVIFDLEKSLDSLAILNEKYENILWKYVELKKDNDLEKKEEFNNKMKVLYYVIAFSLLLYVLKYFLAKKFVPKYESYFLYFDLIHWIILIIFLIAFFFYIFPQLYVLLIFISGSLIFVNAPLISSFVSSVIVFRKYKIWDVIKYDENMGRIKMISPLFTTMSVLNKYWVISNDIETIPNNLLIKEKVMIIQEPSLIDHEFSVALPLNGIWNIFKIIDEIKVNILLKNLNQRIANINHDDEETFKIFHTQTKPDFIMINFTWRASPNRSRKLEAKIISYVYNYTNQYKANNGPPDWWMWTEEK